MISWSLISLWLSLLISSVEIVLICFYLNVELILCPTLEPLQGDVWPLRPDVHPLPVAEFPDEKSHFKHFFFNFQDNNTCGSASCRTAAASPRPPFRWPPTTSGRWRRAWRRSPLTGEAPGVRRCCGTLQKVIFFYYFLYLVSCSWLHIDKCKTLDFFSFPLYFHSLISCFLLANVFILS